MNRVNWDNLDPATFEEICSVLVSRLHPNVQRIDGAGGDGGRDVQVPAESGPIIFEMKSFTGRLGAARRQQVRNSLRNAANHSPSVWNLVVPIDPTPNEIEWFDTLAAAYSFECHWLGLTWLNDHMASHPDIYRHYLDGTNDEVVEVLRELAQEQAALTRGVPDALDRMKVLSTRANQLDPHYSFGLAVDKDGVTSVSVWPKYVGAEHERPIKVNASFAFPDSDEGRAAAAALRKTFDYGTPSIVVSEFVKRLEVDMPAGLGGSFSGGEIRLGPAATEATGFTAQWRILDESGRAVGQLHLVPKSRNVGARGADLRLTDATQTVEVALRLDAGDMKIKAHFSYNRPVNALPSTVLPVLQFMSQVRPPHSAVLLIDGKEASPPTPIDKAIAPGIDEHLALVRALDDIQRATGIYFPIPESFTDEELGSIASARRLLAGESVQSTLSSMTIKVPAGELASVRAAIESGPGPLVAEAELTVRIAGQEIPLGLTRQTTPNVVVQSWPELPADFDPTEFVDVTLTPGGNSSLTTVLIGERSFDTPHDSGKVGGPDQELP
ncbi:hypothetical protein KBX37_24685 [Micromonospora sp. U56]|uniref:hypothetical protein n=1 Tax=Micromonospora sp. U56 TaxID=2824900 RepID=UPI001B37CA26|nr:hypothetical protein [Micromonospora sp. U56]MBQ0896251.1 hypothetical protein [Micromonospora sp. U56]